MRKPLNTLIKSFDITSQFSFYLILAFLFLINFSIFGCYIIFILLLIEMFVFYLKGKNLPIIPKYFQFFFIFIFFTLLSTIFSIDKLNSLKDNRSVFIFFLIPIFIIIINSKKRLNLSLGTILISTVISSLLGIFATIKQGISLQQRIKGLTSHWMTYSGLLMCAFIFFFVFLIFEKRKNIRIPVGISLVIMMAAILFSQTRSVWVGIAFSIAFFIVIINPKIIFYIIPSILLLIIILPESVKDRVLSIFDPDNETNKDRVYMIYTGLNIFKDHPITGVGSDNIKQEYRKYRHPDAKQDNPHLHNNFIQILAERGIFALVSLIVVFVFIFINLIQKIKNSLNFEKTIAYGSLFVFIGFLIAGLFEYNFGDTEVKFLLFFFLSIPFLPFYSKNQ